MKGKFFFLMLMASFWPVRANELSGGSHRLTVTPAPTRVESAALERSLANLQRRRYNRENQGILVESLDGTKVLAEFNADVTFNPASVMKLATSFAALTQLGPDYRFQTSVYGDSQLDTKKKSLPGSLYVHSDGNPVFGKKEAAALSRSLVRRGLRRVEGDLVVVGPLCLDERYTGLKSAEQLRRALTRSGIAIKGKLRLYPTNTLSLDSKVLYLRHTSDRLRDILWEQNAHSVNEIADRLGDLLGGAAGVQQFLIENCRLESHEIYVDRPSGLEHNRMSARAAVRILRQLYSWLSEHQMKLQDIMPVAGLDEGTLYGRFRDPDFRGGVLGKTGTNPSKDGGVCALAGLVYTRDHGPVLYAILNSHGSVNAYRRWQDNFLKDLIEENGGLGEYLPAHEDLDGMASAWMPSEYWGSLAQAPERRAAIKKARSSSTRKYGRSRRGSSRSRT
ncbi:MAG: D-alanyl-D-alanine carboxypeptidase [Acidobacteria bacterium]|nr:D-alanyl-D-alanine carboxypeptidase [Acidobacteriota bacterium]MCI0719076.1 D-alanyl-D-alanine carboxypeptidase [Acidobacteriota bacterium]